MEPKLTKNSDLVFNLENFKNYLEERKEQSVNTEKRKERKLLSHLKSNKRILVIFSIFTGIILISGVGFIIARNQIQKKVPTDKILIANKASELEEDSAKLPIPTSSENNEETVISSDPVISVTPTAEVTIVPTSTPFLNVPRSNNTARTTNPTATPAPNTSQNNTSFTPASTPFSTATPTSQPTVEPTPTSVTTPEPTPTPTSTPSPLPTEPTSTPQVTPTP